MASPNGSSSNNSSITAGDSFSGAGQPTDDHQILLRPKKPPGRPKGSKNKPKTVAPLANNEQSLKKTAIIDIPAGADVGESLLHFCRRHQVGITVLNASGWVAHITLRHQPTFPIPGPFPILSLSGTIMESPSSAAMNSPEYSFPLVLLVSGSKGGVLGGMVGGRVTAVSTVRVVVMKTEFRSIWFERLVGDDKTNDNKLNGDIWSDDADNLNPALSLAPTHPILGVSLVH